MVTDLPGIRHRKDEPRTETGKKEIKMFKKLARWILRKERELEKQAIDESLTRMYWRGFTDGWKKNQTYNESMKRNSGVILGMKPRTEVENILNEQGF